MAKGNICRFANKLETWYKMYYLLHLDVINGYMYGWTDQNGYKPKNKNHVFISAPLKNNATSTNIKHNVIYRYDDLDKIKKEIEGMDEDKRSYRADASGALRLGRQMLSSYFDRRNDAPAAIIFITDEPSNINVNEIVSSSCVCFKQFLSSFKYKCYQTKC